MDDRNQQPFERQVADVAQRAVGPERHVEALAIARHAHEGGRQRRSGRFFGVIQFAAGALVVALFGAVLLMSGVLDGPEEGEVGASPSPSAEATSQGRVPAAKVGHATGAFTETEPDWGVVERLQVSGEVSFVLGGMSVESGELEAWPPTRYAVDSTDPRLSGDAIALTATVDWTHTITAADVDLPRPDQEWSLRATVGRLEIVNDEGTWKGTIGPTYEAVGEEPIDNIVDNAPRLFGGTPVVLAGGGAYDGQTTYIWPDTEGLDGTFSALVVNSAPLGPVSEQTWAEGLAWLEAVDAASTSE